ncbi:MAG: hypothetical protein GW917_04035, partial [Bdellovibrionales bacterium]|nr:hypothetical protein [Bdellovibrionales bacterium]
SGLGTASTKDFGTSAGNLVELDGGGKIPASLIPASASGDILNGGNTTGATVVVGTNDAQSLQFETNNSPAMTILSGGNVGIGTATPNSPLVIEANTTDYTRLRVRNTNASGGSGFYFGSDSDTDFGAFITLNNTTNATNGGSKALSMVNPYGDITFATAPAAGYAERMRITSAGNIGVGTASPSANLQIGNLTPASTATPMTFSLGGTYSSTAGENAKIKVYDDGTNIYGFGVSSGQLDYISNSSHVFYTGGTQKMTINGSGNVGIGTTSPSSKLDVAGTIQIANGGETCSATSDGGMIRYNGGNLQFCNESAWQTLGVS